MPVGIKFIINAGCGREKELGFKFFAKFTRVIAFEDIKRVDELEVYK